MFKKILIPTDGSPLSDASAKAALEFAAATGAAVVGLSVAQLYPFMLMPEAGAMVDLSVYEDVQDYVHPTVRMPPNPYCDRSMQFATVLGCFALAGFIGIGYWGSQH